VQGVNSKGLTAAVFSFHFALMTGAGQRIFASWAGDQIS